MTPYNADVIVIGSGAGGATFAYACAKAGKSVLLFERGRQYAATEETLNERAMLLEKKPYDDRQVRVNGRPEQLLTGGVVGGSTALYGAALIRPSRQDFHPGRFYGERIPRAIWDWPVEYNALEPYYDEAETLFGVAGSTDEEFGPLEKPRRGFAHAPTPLHPINERLTARNRAKGLSPFRLPLAIDFRRCLRCHVCPGYICPNGARHSSAQLVERSVAAGHRLQLMSQTEVDRFSTEGGRITGVETTDRMTGHKAIYRGKRYALAAGALRSPAILLRSGIDGTHVGRHFMFHLSPIAAGVFWRETGAERAFVKQVGFADYYLGAPRFPHKLGLIQSLPVPGPLMLAKSTSAKVPVRMLDSLRRRMLPLAGIVEDLPDPANRVTLGSDGAVELRHAFSPYDRARGSKLGKLMSRILKSAGAAFCLSRPSLSREHVAHQCGTLRFGTAPTHAVLDPECRLFGHPELFVVDGSFFPTSLGVGPALTIIANALRVAGLVTKEV
jgi:choline dehydrogenase-like flavoprotein